MYCPPTPANALPMMREAIVGAPPQRADAPMKSTVPARKSFLAEKRPKAVDHNRVLAAEARAQATLSQGTRTTCPKVPTMAGWTVATMVVSRANKWKDARRETTTRTHCQVEIRNGNYVEDV